MAWYNKYRPLKWENVIGQEIVKQVLQNGLKNQNVKNSYLLTGPKGTGKTTIARIFANDLNQTDQNPDATIDIVEMDAASNTGIDEVRRLIDSAKTPPMSGKYKVFIIDEIHMLSKNAMNALLKILEEPPKYLIFLLATTNPEKLISTVMSRLTRLNLSNHSNQDLVKRLDFIAKQEGVKITVEGLEKIAKRANGSQRDGINLLETLASFGLEEYNPNNISELLGGLMEETLENACQILVEKDLNLNDLKNLIELLERKGIDGTTFLTSLLEFLLDGFFAKNNNYSQLIDPVSKIISLQLPITTTSSAIALLVNRLKPEKIVQTASQVKLEKKTENLPKSEPVLKNLEEKVEVEKPLEEVQVKNENQDLKEKVETKTENETKKVVNHDPDLQDKVGNFVTKMRYQESCPPALKMIIGISGIYEQKNNSLTLQVPNGIFQSALKSSKIQDWIKQKVEENFGVKPEIAIQIGKKNIVRETQTLQIQEEVVITHNQNQDEVEVSSFYSQEYSQTLEENPFVEGEKLEKKPEKETKQKPEKYFYQVYKKLPENMQNGPVAAYTENIPEPKKKVVEEENDSNPEDFFEFED